MPKTEWRRPVDVGETVHIDGQPLVIQRRSGGWVQLRDAAGATPPMMREAEVAALMPRDDAAPPMMSDRLEAIHDTLSETSKQNFQVKKDLLTWIETGRPPGDPVDAPIEPSWDPARFDEKRRKRAIAGEIARQRGIALKSAQRYISRTLDDATLGEENLLDSRVFAERVHRVHPQMEYWVEEFLTEGEFGSYLPSESKYVLFAAWLLVERGHAAPSQSVYDRIQRDVFARKPHLRLKRRKTAEMHTSSKSPKPALQRRLPKRPGELWFIDSTTSNVNVWDPYAPDPKASVFRPTMTKTLDVAARYVTGRAISNNVGGLAANLALADAFRNMVHDQGPVLVEGKPHPRALAGIPRALTRYPIPPRRLLTDNGKEFLNLIVLATLHRLGVDVEPARVLDPRMKAALERHFGTDKTRFESKQPGYVSGSVDTRGSAAEREACLTWEELFDRDGEWTDLHNTSVHGGLLALTGRRISPNARWIELAEEYGCAEIPAWRNEWIRFLDNEVLPITPFGVTRKKFVYHAPILETLLAVPGAAPGGVARMFYDPSDMRQVYCFDPDGNAWEVPWVGRDDDVEPFSDFTVDRARAHIQPGSLSPREAQKRLIELVTTWRRENALLAVRRTGSTRNEEMYAAQFDRLLATDHGSIRPARAISSEDILDALPTAEAELPDALVEFLDDDLDDFDSGLFEEYV